MHMSIKHNSPPKKTTKLKVLLLFYNYFFLIFFLTFLLSDITSIFVLLTLPGFAFALIVPFLISSLLLILDLPFNPDTSKNHKNKTKNIPVCTYLHILPCIFSIHNIDRKSVV